MDSVGFVTFDGVSINLAKTFRSGDRLLDLLVDVEQFSCWIAHASQEKKEGHEQTEIERSFAHPNPEEVCLLIQYQVASRQAAQSPPPTSPTAHCWVWSER